MRVFVKAKPRARKDKVERVNDNNLNVSVAAPTVKGLANQAIVKAVAQYFKVASSRVSIVSGFTLQQKILEIT